MKKFYVNSVIKNTLNKKFMYHIISIERAANIDASIIEYNLLYENVNGDKIKDSFTHKSFLSEFSSNERKLLTAMIRLKTVIDKETVTEMAYI